MNENFPNLAKEIRLPGNPGSSESPKEAGSRRNTPTHIITKLPNIKDKERILKQQEKRRLLPTMEFPLDY